MFNKSVVLKRDIFDYFSDEVYKERDIIRQCISDILLTYKDEDMIEVIDKLIVGMNANTELFSSLAKISSLAQREMNVFEEAGDYQAKDMFAKLLIVVNTFIGDVANVSTDRTSLDKNSQILLDAKKIELFTKLFPKINEGDVWVDDDNWVAADDQYFLINLINEIDDCLDKLKT